MTLKDIAAKAGVSIATVSYVLNGNNRVGEETRQKVERIIEETGYRSNILAQSLRKNKSFLVGVLVEDITVWHTAYIIDGINHLAEEKGYHTVLSNLRLLSKIESQFDHISIYQSEIEREMDILLRMQVDGIIYVGMHDREIIDIFQNVDKPVVYCYCYPKGKGSSVQYSNKETACEIARTFLEKGHRDFVIVKGREESEPTHRRMEGIQKAFDEAGVRLNPRYVISGDWQYRKTRELVTEILKDPDCPKAFIAMNDEMAVAVRDAATEMGLSIPEDISVSGFDNADIVHYGEVHIMTADRPLREMGFKAMEILLNRIESDSTEDVNIFIPCRLIHGDSVKDLRSSQER